MDWDNDGRKDLLTGESYGYVRIYLNTGTDAAPQFSGYSLLQLAGSTYDVGTRSVPFITDWNNDGKKDVICGETSGRVHLLINTGTDANPVFTSAVYLQDGAAVLDMGEESSPWSADWNGDGRKDLIIGDDYGKIYYYENQGTDEAPVFNGHVLMQAGGGTIDLRDDSRPCVIDWDNDGVLDLLVGDDGYGSTINAGVYFFHGIGPLSIDRTTLSRSGVESIRFAIKAGSVFSGRRYFLLGGASGTEPGTPLPGGAILPLNRDVVSNFILANYNGPQLVDFRGVLDLNGEAAAQLNSGGSVPLPAGTVLNFAYTTEVPYDYQSNAVSVEIVP